MNIFLNFPNIIARLLFRCFVPESNCADIFITRKILCEQINYGNSDPEEQPTILENFISNLTHCTKGRAKNLKRAIYLFMTDFNERWQDSSRTYMMFISANKEWLASSIGFKKYSDNQGRPEKDFDKCTPTAKRLKTAKLRANNSSKKLGFATQMNLREDGFVDASKLVKKISEHPEIASKYLTAMKNIENVPKMLTGAEALSHYVQTKLTVDDYNDLRKIDKQKFPPYKVVAKAKEECYPRSNSIKINEKGAEIELQSLLDHTAQRILLSQKPVLDTLTNKILSNVTLISKWGMDGTTQPSSQQTFADKPFDDSHIFISSIVPIRMESHGTIIWQNPRPSSTRYCRPIEFKLEKEIDELTRFKKSMMDKQIENLIPLKTSINDKTINVSYKMMFTMVDGKVCNAVTSTGSQRCYLCGLTSKDFNKLDMVLRADIQNHENLNLGLSTLHAWIRFLECILHVSYRLTIQLWAATGIGSSNYNVK